MAKLGKASWDAYNQGGCLIDLLKNCIAEGVASEVNDAQAYDRTPVQQKERRCRKFFSVGVCYESRCTTPLAPEAFKLKRLTPKPDLKSV